MTKSVWLSATLGAVLTAAGCDNAAKPTPAPATPTPTAPTPTPPAPTTSPAVEPPPADGIEGLGPFDSIDAYCKDAKSKFVADGCKSGVDQGADMCSCGTDRHGIKGKQKIGPLPEATGLASAQLLLVQRSATGKGDCDLAIETANRRGWFVVPALMPCKNAPVSHDSSTWITVSGFDITREGDIDVLTLAWTETTSNQDVDGTEATRDAGFTTRCMIGATTLPRCTRPARQ
jgi:hypothetical protein